MTTPTPDALAASCRAFALQCKPFGVSGVLNEAADLIQQQQATIERLSAALEPFANMADANMNDPLCKWLTVAHIKEAEAALGKDASDE